MDAQLPTRPYGIGQRRARAVMVRMESPLRLLVQGELRQSISFVDLVQSLSRLLALLSRAYTGHRLEWDEDEMLFAAAEVKTAAEQWVPVDFKRYSMNRTDKLGLPVIEGWARYEGDITPCTPLLAAGELVHMGKNATIGFGQMRVSYDQ